MLGQPVGVIKLQEDEPIGAGVHLCEQHGEGVRVDQRGSDAGKVPEEVSGREK